MTEIPAQERHCAKCVRDCTPGCTHLTVMYDKCKLKGMTDQDLIAYALNRIWALERDNTNKAEGKKASRVYKSRNTIATNALANKCDTYRGALRCMRNAGHPADDRDQHGSHKF